MKLVRYIHHTPDSYHSEVHEPTCLLGGPLPEYIYWILQSLPPNRSTAKLQHLVFMGDELTTNLRGAALMKIFRRQVGYFVLDTSIRNDEFRLPTMN